jgi:20S proteasome alpha/beta subunit
MEWRKSIQSLLLLTQAVTILLFVGTTAVQASSSSSSSTSYTSVRALDQFGNSIQLQHAGEAPRRYGRLVLSAASANTVVVVSLGSSSSSNKPMVHSITMPNTDDDSKQPDNNRFLAMSCTGVKGDANWLIQKVQEQVANIWERYDHGSPRSDAMAYFISRLLGSFNGYDLDREWQSSLQRQPEKWARPLGTQTMVLSTEAPHILMIEPSGTVLSTKVDGESDLSFAAMGKDSDIVMEHFWRLKLLEGNESSKTMDASQLKEMLIKLLLEQLETTSSADGDVEIMVETIESTWIERSVLRYKNGEEIPM